MKNLRSVAIVGSVGVPANYGGFETLAENLVLYGAKHSSNVHINVFCSASAYPGKPSTYSGASLWYVPLNANGWQSIPYDILSILWAVAKRVDTILILGVSGALILPFVRLVSNAKLITNVDGVEWRRDKWRGFAKRFLKFAEWCAIKFSHKVIADNQGIANYLMDTYGASSAVIEYGGDSAVENKQSIRRPSGLSELPLEYMFALCRIEPENNVEMILSAFSKLRIRHLVFVGNWDHSDYARKLKSLYENDEYVHLMSPIYDPQLLCFLRGNASAYVHGHSAGGTNPSLVEVMHFGIPIFAFDCVFNRYTTEEMAKYFRGEDELMELINEFGMAEGCGGGEAMREIASRRYTWESIGARYFSLLASSFQSD